MALMVAATRSWVRKPSLFPTMIFPISPRICTACLGRWLSKNNLAVTCMKATARRGFFVSALLLRGPLFPPDAIKIGGAVGRQAAALGSPDHFSETLHDPVMGLVL